MNGGTVGVGGEAESVAILGIYGKISNLLLGEQPHCDGPGDDQVFVLFLQIHQAEVIAQGGQTLKFTAQASGGYLFPILEYIHF